MKHPDAHKNCKRMELAGWADDVAAIHSRHVDGAGMRLGSLCSGILGLDLAVERHFGAKLVWCAEINPAASRVIAARTDVTNFGDFRNVTPPAVDILAAGFPCQPVSQAGKRAGINDERWLFNDICDLLGRLDPPPRVLVFENVRGLLAANGGDAMARVVEGLARCGYVGSWRTVRASDVGAPHRRERVFLVARLAADSARAVGSTRIGRREPVQPVVGCGAAADAARIVGDGERGHGHDRCQARDAYEVGRQRIRRARDGRAGSPHHNFGPYALAVERWEHIIGRRAPAPVDDRGRLSAAFVEWMMGYPQGWVTEMILPNTDPRPDRISRTDALRCLGNAVVPQQAAHALALLGGAL